MTYVHPLVAVLDKKRIEKKLGIRETARIIGVTYYPLYSWLKEEKTPRPSSLKKVQKAIDKIDNGEWRTPEPKKVEFYYQELPKRMPIGQQIMYGRIQSLEKEYGTLTQVPEDHPKLILLREQVGAV